MGSDSARQTHAIFMRALDVEVSARSEFIEQACSGDTEMLQRVRQLVGALDHSRDYLERPALGERRDVAGPMRPAAVRGYQVVGMIGAGGMATVYEAVQEQPPRRVALKVMSRAFGSSSGVRRFRYETEVLARLQHPGIAQIFEAGTCDDGLGHPAPFFAMEYIEGARTLTQYADEQGLSAVQRLEMFAEVCDAVQHGHQRGVIHRDLKPANIMVGADGRSKVIDFGVARSAEQDPLQTLRADVGQLIGTLNYMSPEQCSGETAVDVRADVYSLGVTLYELLAGRQPYDLGTATLPAAIRIIREEAPPDLRTYVPGARGDLERIVAKAMAKDPEARYSSAGALAADVRRYLHHQPVEAGAPSLLHHAKLFARRHRVLVGAAAAVLAVMLAATVAISVFGFQAAQESQRRAAAEQAALVERDSARRQAYIAGVTGAFASYQLGEAVQARRRLASAPAELRNFEWRLASTLTERGERIIRAHDDLIFGFAASGDNSRVASSTRQGALAVWEVASGRLLMHITAGSGEPIHALALSPDGSRLFAGLADGGIHEWDVERGAYLRRFADVGGEISRIAIGPDGTLACASTRGQGTLWNIADGALLRTIEAHAGDVRGLGFAPDGSRLVTWDSQGRIWLHAAGASQRLPVEFGEGLEQVVLSSDHRYVAAGGAGGRIVIWRAGDAAILHEIETPPWNRTVRSMAFTPDNRWLVTGQLEIIFWNVETGARRTHLVGHEDAVCGMAFSPGGHQLVSASWDGTLRIWDVDLGLPTSPLRKLEGHQGHVFSVAYSPDGELIASGGRDGAVRLWDSHMGLPLAALGDHEKGILSVAYSPTEALVAAGGEDRMVRLWDTRTGAAAGELGEHDDTVWTVVFSPDGSRLATAGEEGVIRIWDVKSRTKLLEIPAQQQRIVQLAFSPDGAMLASGSRDGTAILWDLRSGSLRHLLRRHLSDVFAVVFSPDGTRLYTGSRDRTVGVWACATGEWIESIDAQGQFVTSLAISPDGTRLVAGTWFADVIIWDLPGHDLVATFKGYNAAIRSVAFSPDMTTLACVGHDQTVNLYDSRSRSEQVEARIRAMAALAEAQRVVEGLRESCESAEAMLDRLSHMPLDELIANWTRKVILMKAAVK